MAAVTTANVPVFLLISIVFGVQSGLGILVSQYWGKKDMESISRAIGVAAMLGTGITLVLALVLFLWPVQIMDLLSNKHELSVLGAPYLTLAFPMCSICSRPSMSAPCAAPRIPASA